LTFKSQNVHNVIFSIFGKSYYIAYLKNWGCSLMQFSSNKDLNMAKYEQFAPPTIPPTKKFYVHAIS